MKIFLFLMAIVAQAQPVWRENVVIANRLSAEGEGFRVVQIVEGLSNPWSVAFLPGGELLVTERAGRLWRISPKGVSQISGLPPIRALGQGGLLDITLHPNFATNNLVYFTFSHPGEGGVGTALARARLQANRLEGLQILFSMEPKTGAGQHFGSRLVWLPDGTLLMSIGDRGDRNRAQDPSDPAGSVLRFTEDGQPAPDNPGFRHPAIYTMGNRNIQGMVVQLQTGRVYATEHGPRGGDELNLIARGANYGWPLVTHGREYSGAIITTVTSRPGFKDPLYQWTPSLAPSGLAFYHGSAFPRWEGLLMSGNLAGQRLVGIWLNDDGTVKNVVTILEGVVGRIRDVRLGSDGLVYLLTDNGRDGVFRLEPLR
jgi:glucose/arabinose dehydrogenase